MTQRVPPTGALGNDKRGELVFQRYVNNYNANVLMDMHKDKLQYF